MKEEIAVARTTDIQNGELKEITWGETKIVLAKVNDQFYAVNGICPHLKAPLAKGALCGTRLYCPWHHSAFDITTGHLCEPPALDGLQRYPVRVSGDQIYLQLTPETALAESPKPAIAADKTFVILGGGAAGLMAAQMLRQEGFQGRLLIITKEAAPPYDRTLLSKKFLSGKLELEKLPLRKEDFYQQHRIELEKDKEVKRVDATTKTIYFSDNSSLVYDSLLVATGGQPNKLTIPGAELQNVFTLRSVADAEKILAQAKAAKKVCLIGASFIAMETAASLQTLGLAVTVIAKESLPFEKNFGKEIGAMFLQLHQEKGIVIKANAVVQSIEGNNKATAVLLESGERIETDLVIAGIGVHPVTGFLQGLPLHEKDNSLLVNEQLQAAEDLFAAGDIARYPDAQTGKPVRIEHWRLAQQQGRIAALNMLGKNKSVAEVVPFFWTNQFDKRLSYVGHAENWDELIIDGSVSEQQFLAFYIQNGKVQAVASMGRDVESNKVEDTMRKKGLLTVEMLQEAIRR